MIILFHSAAVCNLWPAFWTEVADLPAAPGTVKCEQIDVMIQNSIKSSTF